MTIDKLKEKNKKLEQDVRKILEMPRMTKKELSQYFKKILDDYSS